MRKIIFKVLFAILLVCIIDYVYLFSNDNAKSLDFKSNVYRINSGIIVRKEASNHNSNPDLVNIVFPDEDVYATEVPVLNYHFFYNPNDEYCDSVLCLNIYRFEEQIKYLLDNDYKILTLNEFIRWKNGEKKLPKKSVLITIDDGAKGTGLNNGNQLIPVLEKYKVNAVLFLITAWFDYDDYRSEYLNVQSHGHDIHYYGECNAKQIHCINHEVLKSDISKSIEIVGDNSAFAYPFFEYTVDSLSVLEELDVDVAFIGGNRKASISDNKYLIPRYEILSKTTMNQFASYVK